MKFWKSPELIVKLLPFLDLKSTLCLVRCHDLTKNILQRGFAWNNLVRRTCPFGWEEDHYVLQHKIDVVKDLMSILKVLKHPKVVLLDILDTICEKVNLIHIKDIEILDNRCVKAFNTIMLVQPSLSRQIGLRVVGPI